MAKCPVCEKVTIMLHECVPCTLFKLTTSRRRKSTTRQRGTTTCSDSGTVVQRTLTSAPFVRALNVAASSTPPAILTIVTLADRLPVQLKLTYAWV